MKLKSDFIVHEANGKTLLVPVGDTEFHGIIQGTPLSER